MDRDEIVVRLSVDDWRELRRCALIAVWSGLALGVAIVAAGAVVLHWIG